MARQRHLSKAPITEGLIDFRVEPPAEATVDALVAAIAQQNNFGYTLKNPIIRGEFGFSLNVEQRQAMASGPHTMNIGVRLHSSDDRYVALLSIEGFTLSRLEPYESWEALLQAATPLWQGYLECLGGGTITRVATRYINNLRLPSTELDAFLDLLPQLPDSLPPVTGFLQRYQLYDPETDATVLLTEALPEGSSGPPVPVILDIDAFREARFPISDRAPWNYLERLRALKNRIFFECLKETGVALYE